MVTKQELQEALANQSTNLKKQLDESVSKIRSEIIDTLACEIKKLNDKIVVLEEKLIVMEKKVESNLQYQRGSSVVISGVPITVNHTELEGIAIKLFNEVCENTILPSNIIACHRISKSSARVLVKFVNKKDTISLLGAKLPVNRISNQDIGLGHCDKFFLEDHLTPYISNLA